MSAGLANGAKKRNPPRRLQESRIRMHADHTVSIIYDLSLRYKTIAFGTDVRCSQPVDAFFFLLSPHSYTRDACMIIYMHVYIYI